MGGWRIAIVLAVLAACVPGARAESRLALVIGNSNYRSVTALPNPVNDARAVAAELKSAAFDVTEALDLGGSDMRRAIRDFGAKAAAKGADAVTLIYYAGHGVQVDGENFLVPVDARIEREADIAGQSVRLAELMDALAAAPSKMRIVILDACRNNPFSTSKQARGLAIVDAPTGSIVAYSTAPGTEATDGAGAHSPYTAAFLEIAKEPRLQIEQLFKQVRLKVHAATNGQQTPWESSSLTTDFWFFPSDESAAGPRPTAVAAAAPTTPPPSRLPQPRSDTASAGQPALQVAAAPAATSAAPQSDPAARPRPTTPSYAGAPLPPPAPAGYADAPVAPPVPDMRLLSADDAYDLAVAEDTVEGYEQFLLIYPNDPRADWVRATLALRIDALAWRYAAVVNTPAAYEAYLARYPGGVYVDEAVRLRLRPRLRPIDVVISPRVLRAPPAPRVALPLIQMRRAPNAPIVLPVVLSRPGRFERRARLAPGQRLPGIDPALVPRLNAATAAPGYPRERLLNSNVAHPNFGAPAYRRQNALNAPIAPNGAPLYRSPVATAAPSLQPAQPPAHQVNPQFRQAQRAQLGTRPKPPPEKCARRPCRP